MSNTKKLIQAAAGAAGGEGLNVEDVFSTYLYDGQSTTLAVNNGIDLAAEDGMTWIKCRNAAEDHFLFSSLQNGSGQTLFLRSNLTNAATAINNVSQTSTGFSLPGGDGQINQTGNTYASWSFRKAPKFFDIVTYTGTGSPQSIAHNLGSVPGCIIVKTYDNAQGWAVYHRGNTSAPETERLILEQTYATSDDNTYWNDTAPTDTHFTVGNTIRTNSNGYNYVAYLFAHNDGDGDFGPTGDQDIIKCGSYTGNGGFVDINLGWEPQWLLVKKTSSTGNWRILDNMRGWVNSGGFVTSDLQLYPNLSDADTAYEVGHPTATGWQEQAETTTSANYIYIAIRRGPMAVPTDATDVFAIDQQNSSEPYYTSNFPVDFGFIKTTAQTGSWYTYSRLQQGRELVLNTTVAETAATNAQFDYMDGFYSGAYASDVYSWMWKRAPSFCDVVAYTGTGTTLTVNHNLGVVPEMMWIKNRSSAQNWAVYHTMDSSGFKLQFLNNTDSQYSYSYPSSLVSQPTATSFQVGGFGTVGDSGNNYIAYLFASLAGVSKVGSVTHTFNTTTNVDCGFSSGARFVLIKSSSDIGPWRIWDSTRGIVAGNDPYLHLNDTQAEITNGDLIDPYSSGFALSPNFYSETYIYYAIA